MNLWLVGSGARVMADIEQDLAEEQPQETFVPRGPQVPEGGASPMGEETPPPGQQMIRY